MNKLFVLLIAFGMNVAYAGPISSGGVPETAFQHDRAAIQTILDTDDVLGLLQYKGAIIAITAVNRQKDVYSVSTAKCELHVQFSRTHNTATGQWVSSAKVLLDESSGDCAH